MSSLIPLLLLAAALAHSSDWPQWRGPRADGVAPAANPPVSWSRSQNVRWSAALPGWGTSSPVLHGDKLFVTSEIVENGKRALYTLCFDRHTGRELWRHSFPFGVDQRVHQKSNLAVNTPAATPDALFVAFGNSDVARYTHDGQLLWVTRYLELFGDPRMAWGYGASPVVLPDSVLLPWDHHKGPCFLIGLDPSTGKIRWQLDRPIGTSHATPLLVSHHGQTDILVSSKHRLTAFNAETREQLWSFGEGEGPFNGEIVNSPVFGDGLVFFQLWRQTPIYAVRLSPDGRPPEPVWVSRRTGPQEPSLLYYQGLLYAWMDNGVLTCLDALTGEEVYRRRVGGPANSSPVAAAGRIYLSDNDGMTYVIRAGRTFELLSTNPLGERITASPALSGPDLYIRTDSQIFCLRQVP
ncbi:MAG: PQQ-binding-like beta-propeller repeat protein [Bryobacteraceae bacterium]|nr:PQQ-binding-like beta-propeller repeat protein [Bryobacteraceae bacterium]